MEAAKNEVEWVLVQDVVDMAFFFRKVVYL
jgi:hypothetical protein